MNKKGFTLVEFLGVFIILIILGVLVSQVVFNNIKKSNENLEKSAESLIISAARDYVSLNENNYPKTANAKYCIDYDLLSGSQLINDNMLPKIDNIDTIKSKHVVLKYNGNIFEYSLETSCSN